MPCCVRSCFCTCSITVSTLAIKSWAISQCPWDAKNSTASCRSGRAFYRRYGDGGRETKAERGDIAPSQMAMELVGAVHLLRVAVVEHVVCSDVSRAGRGRLFILTPPLVVPQGQLGQHESLVALGRNLVALLAVAA